jgi:hypothetical protein
MKPSYAIRIAATALMVVASAMVGTSVASAKEPPPTPAESIRCDDTLKTSFRPDALTTVLLVKPFTKGEPLSLTGTPDDDTPLAKSDLCLVKLLVGPGAPGPEDAPSTSPGIGIEVWLPTIRNWNGRIHVKGGGGWAGGPQTSATDVDLPRTAWYSAAETAGVEGAVSATTDTGHSFMPVGGSNAAGGNGSFALLPDGSTNQILWRDFASRGIHEMAIRTKELTTFFYGRPAAYSYWDGFSTGGRQGLMEAQANPADFDGILVGAPAINWSSFATADLYPQIVMERELGPDRPSVAQLSAVSQVAIAGCDNATGVHLGYITEPAECHYNPALDDGVLCADDGGHADQAWCVNRR